MPSDSTLIAPNEPASTIPVLSAEAELKLVLLNQHLDLLYSCSEEADKQVASSDFQQYVEDFTAWTLAQGLSVVSRESKALDAFLKELSLKPDHINASRLRTIALAVNTLGALMRAPQPKTGQGTPPVAVVVDDDHVSCTAACMALRNAGLTPMPFAEPSVALDYLPSHPVDLVVLDMRMAGDSGFDFYNKLRELPLHHETPAIFVTNPSDPSVCSSGSLSDADTQILAKPYNMLTYLELALKGLSRVLKHQARSRTETVITAAMEQKPAPAKPSEENAATDAPTAMEPQASTKAAVPDPAEEPKSAQAQVPSGNTEDVTRKLELAEEVKKSAEELETAKAEPDRTTAPLDAEPSGPLTTAKTGEEEAQAPLEGKIGQTIQLEATLAKAPQEPEELNREAAEKKAAAAFKEATEKLQSRARGHASEGRQVAELERRMREGVSSCARLTADLEKERGERRRVEQRANALAGQLQELHGQLRQHLESEALSHNRVVELEEELRQRDESVHRANGDLHKEKMEHQLAEEQLKTSADLCVQLRNCLSSFEEAKKGYKRTQDEMQAQLQALQSSSKQAEAKWQKEVSDRQRLEEALHGAQRDLEEQTQRNTLRVTELESALEVEKAERRRIETEAIELRFASLHSARANLATVNKLQRQFGEPVERLMRSACRLLESPLEADAKILVESLLEDVLLLQGNLQEIGNSAGIDSVADQSSEQGPGAQDLAA